MEAITGSVRIKHKQSGVSLKPEKQSSFVPKIPSSFSPQRKKVFIMHKPSKPFSNMPIISQGPIGSRIVLGMSGYSQIICIQEGDIYGGKISQKDKK